MFPFRYMLPFLYVTFPHLFPLCYPFPLPLFPIYVTFPLHTIQGHHMLPFSLCFPIYVTFPLPFPIYGAFPIPIYVTFPTCYLSHPFQIYYLHKCHLIQPPLWLVCYPSICDLFPQCFLSPPPLMARTCFLCVTRMLPDYLLHYLLPVPSVCYLAASCVYLLIVSGYVS